MMSFLKKLQPYCWGLNIINFPVFEKESATISSRRLALCGSARNFDYLDAGLGLILCEDAKYMYRSFNQYGVAVDIRNAIRNKSLKKVLSEPIPRHRILMASEKLKIKNNISRLIAFYKKLM